MILQIYAIRDLHTGYTSVTVDQNDSTAFRNFSHAVNRSDSVLNSSPKDFSLMCLGTFDSESGRIEAFDNPRLVAEASDCLRIELDVI